MTRHTRPSSPFHPAAALCAVCAAFASGAALAAEKNGVAPSGGAFAADSRGPGVINYVEIDSDAGMDSFGAYAQPGGSGAFTIVFSREQLEAALADSKARLPRYERELIEARQRHVTLEGRAAAALNQLTEAGLSPQAVEPVMQTLIVRKLEYELDLHGKAARREAILSRITTAREDENVTTAARSDRLVLEQHESLIRAAEAELARTEQLYKRGVITDGEVDKARAKLAQARIEYELQKAQIEERRRPDADALTTELRDLSIDMTELTARHAFVVGRLKACEAMPALRDHYLKLTQTDIPAAARHVEQAQSRINSTQAKIDRYHAEIERLKIIEEAKRQLEEQHKHRVEQEKEQQKQQKQQREHQEQKEQKERQEQGGERE